MTVDYFFSHGHGFNGASPDGVAVSKSEKWLIEIKCPSSEEKTAIIDACKSTDFYCTCKDGEISLKNPIGTTPRFRVKWVRLEYTNVTL